MKQSSNMEHIGDFNPDGKADLDQLLLDRKTYNPMIADDIVSAPLAAGKSLYSILRMIWQRLRLKVRKETCCCMMEG